MRPLLQVLVVLVLVLGAQPARAATVSAWVCAKLATSYIDTAATITQLDDDYIRDNTAAAARGVHLVVTDNTTNTVVQELYLPDADPACAPALNYNTARTYKIQVKSDASVANNTIVVRNDDVNNQMFVSTIETAWVPVAGQKTVTTGIHNAWNLLRVATWAMHRRSTGLSGENITFFLQTCPTIPGASCASRANSKLYIDPSMQAKKFVPVHEMGHRIAQLHNQGNHADIPTLSPVDGNCTGNGDLIEKKYTSFAAAEGIAHYYAAVAFNDTTGANCEVQRNGDYNLNAISGEVQFNEKSPSCEGDPSQETWAPADFLGNHCIGLTEDRGTELDWLRLFWDLDHFWGLSSTTLFDLWDQADPDTWDGVGGGTASNDVEERFTTAADPNHVNVAVPWSAAANANGAR